MIHEHDRALFQLEKIPNNRLPKRTHPYGNLRSILERDVESQEQSLCSGAPSIDGIKLADLWYAHKSRGDMVYVYEIENQLAGFIHFYSKGDRKIFVDVLAVDKKYQGQNVGGILMRWAENWARCNLCREIALYAINDKIDFYKNMGYAKDNSDPLTLRDGEVYQLMTRKLLYNLGSEYKGIGE